MNDVIKDIRSELEALADEKTRENGKRFFKEEIKVYGTKSADVRKISKSFFKKLKDSDKKEIFGLCEELWKSGYMEESFIACNWSYYIKEKYGPEDFKTFEKWVSKYVSNWASCDTLCNHTVGDFILMYPEFISELKRWALSENRWMKRAAAVSLIIPARKGEFLADIFEIADILLMDQDDLVQKGYGWMLKAAGEAHQKEVYEYVLNKKDVMPRTSLRYAIEKMPAEMRKTAMKK